ncbi:hypothetical protein PoB_007317900 [Plakobranchus ocellatus]|uniref:Uncharacterized protein n=1 Tax=Plakobranchus ocellatus TaxID=259542 RepID=A0AAV4DR47_9GAST|nr:hypothetical protein PoB_007317900 [Plakobranchus ocellatus]
MTSALTTRIVPPCWISGSCAVSLSGSTRAGRGKKAGLSFLYIASPQQGDLRQARAPVAGLEPATEGSLQISGRKEGGKKVAV